MKRINLDRDHSAKIMAMPIPLFPYRFNNGFVVEFVDFRCSACGRNIPLEWLRGEFGVYGEMSASLDGYALCEPCKLVMPIALRIRNDGTMLVRSNDNSWEIVRYAEPGFGDHILLWLRRMISGLGV